MFSARTETRYARSKQLLDRALRTIPLGSQTFSKSKTQYPVGAAPLFARRAEGSRLWDVDGNEYVDFVNGLAAVNLGYNDPDVTAAVRAQLDDGVIFSLPHPLECEVAEKIVEMVPCAEMVRFGKNGSDATAGAVRLARAFTGRDHVAVCGYHGWQDWYIGSTARNKGVPQSTCQLTHPFTYNDLDSLRRVLKEYSCAAVIMEPMNTTHPQPGFLEGVKALAHDCGALLIFDETVTGFRFADGGAQQYFGVSPDLATFGKAMANGYPISAVVGRADVMLLMEEVFFSLTFGGETLSLAAAIACMRKLQRDQVTQWLYETGTSIMSGVSSLIEKHEVSHLFSISGHPAWSFLLVSDTSSYPQTQIKTLLLQEMFDRGILTIGTHNVSFAHRAPEVERLLNGYDEVFPLVRDAVRSGTLLQMLRCEPLEPLFKVR